MATNDPLNRKLRMANRKTVVRYTRARFAASQTGLIRRLPSFPRVSASPGAQLASAFHADAE